MQERIEELLVSTGRRGGASVVAGVIAGGEQLIASWSPRAQPSPDEHSVFEIGSLTKPFTGVLLAEMHLRGEVDLADPLSRYLPPHDTPSWRGAEPTLVELASHRAGLPNTPRGMLLRELAVASGLRGASPWEGIDGRAYRALLHRQTARRRAGRRVRYSSLGFGLLGDALAARVGRPFGELLSERLLEPLGMQATAVTGPTSFPGRSRRGRPRPAIDDRMTGGGGLRSTAHDVVRWLEACLRPPNDPPGPALKLAQRPRPPMGRRASVGLGWIVLERRGRPAVVWHNGLTYGFRSFGGFVPRRQVAVVALATGTRSLDRLGFALIDAALEAGRP